VADLISPSNLRDARSRLLGLNAAEANNVIIGRTGASTVTSHRAAR
jgi:hypothetical protein